MKILKISYYLKKREGKIMEILKTVAIVMLSLSAIIIFFIAFFSKKLLKTLLLNALSGVAVLILVNLLSKYIGVYLPINQWTTSFSAVFGLPAVVGMIFFNIIL